MYTINNISLLKQTFDFIEFSIIEVYQHPLKSILKKMYTINNILLSLKSVDFIEF